MKRIFGKFNIIDLLLVIIILIVIIGVVHKFSKSNTVVFSQTKNIQVTFFNEDVANYAIKSIKKGNVVKDRTSGAIIGKVTKVDIGPDIYYASDSEGKMKKSSKDGYNSVQITVLGKGVYSGNGVTFGNADFYINRQIDVFFGDSVLFTRISGINVIGEQ